MSVGGVGGDWDASNNMDFGDIEAPALPGGTTPPVEPSVAKMGWASPRAPNGRVLPRDLSSLDENALLKSGKTAALYAVGDGPGDFHPEREPLILVHGIDGDPKNLQAVADRYKNDPRYQVYVLCYDDNGRRTSLNGGDMANELRALQQKTLGAGRDVTIVAHSMGGIVAREALDELTAGPGKGIEKFGKVNFTAVDTPWHGYGGPSDRGIGGAMMNFVRPFMPDGLEDMRAQSDMFQGDPKSSDPAAKAGLFGTEMPDNVETHLVFAQDGSDIFDYTEGPLKGLPQLLADHFNKDTPVTGSPQLVNFWKALLSSSDYDAFADEMRDDADAGTLDANTVLASLEKNFPRFGGDHDGVLKEQPTGKPSFLDWLQARLDAPGA